MDGSLKIVQGDKGWAEVLCSGENGNGEVNLMGEDTLLVGSPFLANNKG